MVDNLYTGFMLIQLYDPVNLQFVELLNCIVLYWHLFLLFSQASLI